MFSTLRPLAHKSAIWLLRKLNPGDIRIRHHYTRDRFTLDAFKHKGYWYHGKRREAETMHFFKEVIFSGDTVFEAGGHIGYLSMYFTQLCGPSGRVIVFEPSPENLQYLRKNTEHLPQVTIVDKAVGSSNGPRELFIEDLTGQNNSFYSDYDVFKKNTATAGYDAGGYHSIRVEVITVDDFCRENSTRVDFVKIDIEGAELKALRGMEKMTEKDRPRFMVEVSRNIAEVFQWFSSRGYLIFDDNRRRLTEPTGLLFNIFCFHQEAHAELIARLGLDTGRNQVSSGKVS